MKLKASRAKILIRSGCLAAVVQVASAAEITLPVQADTWVSGLASTAILGADTRLGICPVANYWIYLKFDLSGVAGSVTGAELRMRRVDGSRPEEISVYLITDDSWSEASLNGPTRPAPQNPLNSAALGVGALAATYDFWASTALAQTVEQQRQGDGILTLMLREDPGAVFDIRHYFSREAPIVDADKPRLVLTLASGESVAAGWRVSDIGEGTMPSFDFGVGESVHIMAMTEEAGGEVWYAQAHHLEGPWSPMEVAQGHFTGPGDLRVAPDATVHLVWRNQDTQDPDHLAIHPNGSLERFTIDTPSLDDGWDNSLDIGADGRLHQACIYPVASGALNSLQYGRFDGAAWTFENAIAGSGPAMNGLNTAIAVDPDGIVHVAYCQATDWTSPGELKHAKRDMNGWQVSTVVSNGVRGRFPSIDLDHWNQPHIAWLDFDDDQNTNRATVRYGHFNNNEWTIETVDTLDDVQLGMFGARKSVSLALDVDSRPHIAYADTRRIAYAAKPFDQWLITNVAAHTDPTYNGLVVLRLNAEDAPAIVFWQPDPGTEGLVRLAGPLDPNIRIFPLEIHPETSAVTLRWSAGPEGMGYQVEARDDFESGEWNVLSGPELLLLQTWTEEPGLPPPSSRYYRILAQPLGP